MTDRSPSRFPPRAVDGITRPLARFMRVEAASGLVLVAATITALAVASSTWGPDYQRLWERRFIIGFEGALLAYPLWYWVNDALMTLFFFVVGLEIKRELVAGELREPRKVVLPMVSALGGALAPVGIYVFLQHGRPGASGWAIPMATDIAFVMGALALLGSRVPHGLKVFLLTLAIADDLLGVMVIAVAFTEHLSAAWAAFGVLGIFGIAVMNRIGVRAMPAYFAVGAAVWLCTLKSGLHPTLAGVALGLLTPSRRWLEHRHLVDVLSDARATLDDETTPTTRQHEAMASLAFAAAESASPLERLERGLHPWIAFLVMPVFALANAAIAVRLGALADPIPVAVVCGLVIGKPLGITLAAGIAVAAGAARLPTAVTWPMIAGAGCLAGIGFTMALFLAGLSLEGSALLAAKQGVLAGSLLSAVLGMVVLSLTLPRGPR